MFQCHSRVVINDLHCSYVVCSKIKYTRHFHVSNFFISATIPARNENLCSSIFCCCRYRPVIYVLAEMRPWARLRSPHKRLRINYRPLLKIAQWHDRDLGLGIHLPASPILRGMCRTGRWTHVHDVCLQFIGRFPTVLKLFITGAVIHIQLVNWRNNWKQHLGRRSKCYQKCLWAKITGDQRIFLDFT